MLVLLERGDNVGELAGFLQLGDQLLGRGGAGQLVEELGDRRGRKRADELAYNLAVAEGLHRRDPLDLVALRELLVRVDVDLDQLELAGPRPRPARSSTGPSVRQGPHQAAQKSTTTGSSRERSSTSRSKLSVVTSIASSFLSAVQWGSGLWPRVSMCSSV